MRSDIVAAERFKNKNKGEFIEEYVERDSNRKSDTDNL